MKALKRFGAVLVTLLALTAVLTGTALAAEPGDGGISVQLNGRPVVFTDAAPEFSGGRTFVPLRAVLEAMDAQVDYNAGAVAIHRGGVDLSMVLGESRATVTANGQTRTMTMDVAPYVKNDRTYVPVRFVAEAFGCSVGWDQDANTVVIVDVDALFGDATFDLMDNFAAYCNKQNTGNMAMAGTLKLDVADKSGSYLPQPISAKGNLEGISGDRGAQLNWKLEVSGLSELLSGGASSPMEQILMQQMLAALSNLEGEVRVDMEKPAVYLTLPASLTGASEGTWYSLDLGAYQAQLLNGLDMTQLAQLKDAGIREALTAVLSSIPVDDSRASYDALALMASMYVDLLSDQAFTQKGNSYVAEMTLEGMVDLTVTLAKKGDDITAVDIKMDCDAAEAGEKVTMTMTEHAAPDKVTVTMKMEIAADGISVKCDLDLTGVPTRKAPVTAPPSGAAVVPMG